MLKPRVQFWCTKRTAEWWYFWPVFGYMPVVNRLNDKSIVYIGTFSVMFFWWQLIFWLEDKQKIAIHLKEREELSEKMQELALFVDEMKAETLSIRAMVDEMKAKIESEQK